MTIAELKKWLEDNYIKDDFFRIGDSWFSLYDGFALTEENGQYLFFYTERGKRSDIETFSSEAAACQRALTLLEGNEWASSHMVGIFDSKGEAEWLVEVLENAGISTTSDDIPYASWLKPKYRVFVSGSDFEKAKALIASPPEYPPNEIGG